MPFNLLLLPLIAGYLFCVRHKRTYFAIKLLEKERLLLFISTWGLAFLTISLILVVGARFALLVFLFDLSFSDSLKIVEADLIFLLTPNIPSKLDYRVLLTLLISSIPLIFALISAKILNMRDKKNPERFNQHVISNYGNDLERFIYARMLKGDLIRVSLSSGKVYIGKIYNMNFFGARFYKLVPYKSGFRDPNTKEIKLTTNYEPVIKEFVIKARQEYMMNKNNGADAELYTILNEMKGKMSEKASEEFKKALNGEEERLKKEFSNIEDVVLENFHVIIKGETIISMAPHEDEYHEKLQDDTAQFR